MSNVVSLSYPAAESFNYFPIARYWNNKLKPIIERQEFQDRIDADFRKYIIGKENDINLENKVRGLKETVKIGYRNGSKPRDVDSCDWRLFRLGRPPAFDAYVCLGACHWIANSLLLMASEAFPRKDWRIVTSVKHTTVWDGRSTFFDINFLGLGVSVGDCYASTLGFKKHRVLPVGKQLFLHN